jgi:hypothetical protein
MDYTTLIEKLDEIRQKYPKVYRKYKEANREYSVVQADILMRVHAEYASQPLREKAVIKEMEASHEDLINRYEEAEYEFNLIEMENKILYTMSKLLMAREYG